MHRCPVPDRPRLAREYVQAHVDAVGRSVQGAIDDPVAARDGSGADVAAREVEGAALAGARTLGRAVLGMDTANTGFKPAGGHHQTLPGGCHPRVHGPGNPANPDPGGHNQTTG
ncbi:MAG: hypothetical protein OXD35_13125, partial [Thiotrichales bacterium]|nr:hypothetical protein [Thiotrichales bacterium]